MKIGDGGDHDSVHVLRRHILLSPLYKHREEGRIELLLSVSVKDRYHSSFLSLRRVGAERRCATLSSLRVVSFLLILAGAGIFLRFVFVWHGRKIDREINEDSIA